VSVTKIFRSLSADDPCFELRAAFCDCAAEDFGCWDCDVKSTLASSETKYLFKFQGLRDRPEARRVLLLSLNEPTTYSSVIIITICRAREIMIKASTVVSDLAC
jgi:hypothetical protein